MITLTHKSFEYTRKTKNNIFFSISVYLRENADKYKQHNNREHIYMDMYYMYVYMKM